MPEPEITGMPAFLTARLAEDAKRWQKIWRFKHGDRRIDGWWDLGGTFGRLVDSLTDTTRGGREVRAKRKHLEMWRDALDRMNEARRKAADATDETSKHAHELEYDRAVGAFDMICDVLTLDVAIYAEHPEYDQNWPR